MTQKLIGLARAAESLGISYWGLRLAAQDGRIQSVKCGRRRLIPLTEIERVTREGFPQRMPTAVFDGKSLASGERGETE
jgi:excisionase family DNA binding protein